MLQKKMENGNGFGNAETLKNKGFSIICCQCCHILYMKIEINNKNTYMAYMTHIIQGYIRVRTRATATQEGCSMLEREIEKRLVDGIRNQGGRAYKFVSPGNDGVPDRIVILPGKAPKFIELKTETGKLSNLQRVQITRLKDLGQDVRVLYGLEDVKEFLEEMQHGI